jgi:uncharacterized coiled-coil DUF342 family protein
MVKNEKLERLKEELVAYEEKLRIKMLGYRGVIHESAASELKHTEVMVLKAMVRNLKAEIENMELAFK